MSLPSHLNSEPSECQSTVEKRYYHPLEYRSPHFSKDVCRVLQMTANAGNAQGLACDKRAPTCSSLLLGAWKPSFLLWVLKKERGTGLFSCECFTLLTGSTKRRRPWVVGRGTHTSVNIPHVFLRSWDERRASYKQALLSASSRPEKKKKKWCIIRGFRYEKAVNARLFEEKEQEWCPENSSVLCALKPWMPMGREIY